MSKEVNILKNVKVIVKPIDKHRAFFPEGHDGKIRYSGCTSTYTLPWKMSTRSFVRIFEDGEQDAFEKALDLEKGVLNLYKRKESWWSKFNISLDKDEKILDLSSPIEALEYRVLKANKGSIAVTKGDYNGTQDYYLIDEGVVEEDGFKLSEKREEAMEIFIKMRKSDSKMYDLLRVMGRKPNASMKSNTKFLKSELDKIIAQIEKVAGLSNIDDFLTSSKDKLFQEKVFVLDAVEIGEVEVAEGVYKMSGSGQPLGRSLKEVAEYFSAPKNQEDKLLIQQRVELNK